MPILDSLLIFGEEQAITSLGDTASTNVIKQGAGEDAFGSSLNKALEVRSLDLLARVTEAFASATSAGTLTITLQKSDDGSSWTDVFSTKAFTISELTAGTVLIRDPIPKGDVGQYMRLKFTVGTEAMTAGKVSAWLEWGAETPK